MFRTCQGTISKKKLPSPFFFEVRPFFELILLAYKRTFTAPTSLLNLIHLKRSAFKQWKRCPSDENYKIYTKYRNKVKYESNNAKRVKEQFVAKSSKENPKYFYQYAKSKLKIKENISSLLKDDGTLTIVQ